MKKEIEVSKETKDGIENCFRCLRDYIAYEEYPECFKAGCFKQCEYGSILNRIKLLKDITFHTESCRTCMYKAKIEHNNKLKLYCIEGLLFMKLPELFLCKKYKRNGLPL